MNTGTILIVDDNKGVLASLELLLENYFSKILTASNPNQITTLLTTRRIDVVILDMNFSAGINNGNEGLYWLGHIRQMAPTLPVVMLTAYGDVELAVKALKNKEIRKIILSRPAVEAGEKLGFLPGEMKDKLDPYLQPLYDALQDMVPGAKLKEYMENNVIQIAPLAFMRGRTLNDAVIILDEAQNTTTHQIKMFLTRLGMNAKMIITGDVTQIDLPPTATSGLVQAMQILKGVKGIGKVEFEKKDIVRHKLVQRIVEAYDKFDSKHGKGGSRTVSKEQQEEIKNNINNSQDAR